jgi:hypothetical protein
MCSRSNLDLQNNVNKLNDCMYSFFYYVLFDTNGLFCLKKYINWMQIINIIWC